MNFKNLYEFSLREMQKSVEAGKLKPVSIYDIKRYLVDNVEWLGDINFYPVNCSPEDPYGHFECHGEQESRWEDPESWVVVITYNDDDDVLNFCGRRFVWLKELMHIFDPEDSYTCSKDHFFDLMSDIETRPIAPSSAYLTETVALWLALMVFVPKPFRDEAKEQIESGEASEYEIALKFRIPEAVVSALISKHYEDTLNTYLQ